MQVATKQQCRGNFVLLKLPIHTHFGRFWEHDQMTTLFVLNLKGTSLGGNTSFEPLKRDNRSSGSTRAGRRIEKKNMIVENSQYFAYMGECPTLLIEIKIFVVGNLPYIITRTKFHNKIFSGYDFSWGQISYFILIFVWAYNSAACDYQWYNESWRPAIAKGRHRKKNELFNRVRG